MATRDALWNKFLATTRLCGKIKSSTGGRRPFDVDYDAVLWCDPFRRLVDKTQVFPLSEEDHVHTRLTHSLEVASVGRTIASSVAVKLRDELSLTREHLIVDLSQIVSAACLAHDIGNPPFGHFGEKAIGDWVANNKERLEALLTAQQYAELCAFEGNALGFRILVRHQQPLAGGLGLTHATLAAGAKYPGPRSAMSGNAVHNKKFGYFEADSALFKEVAEATGLLPDGAGWHRHPLAWLVEAADDIANAVIDLEDGVRMGAITNDEAIDALRPIAQRLPNLAENEGRYRSAGHRGYLAAFRSLSVGFLVSDVADAFAANIDAIEAGKHKECLVKLSPSAGHIKALKDLVKRACFNHRDVLDVEIAGHRVIGTLLDTLMSAAVLDASTALSQKIIERLRFEFSEQAQGDPYLQVLEVLEFVAGMTDRFAVRTFRRLTGVELPGRAG